MELGFGGNMTREDVRMQLSLEWNGGSTLLQCILV